MNSDVMKNFRLDLLAGQKSYICKACHNEEQFAKVSGRQRQLLKSVIEIHDFDKMLCSSPHYEWFDYSYSNNGITNQLPVDLQIDLGSTCNSSCIMCEPAFSSRLAVDYNKLRPSNPKLFNMFPLDKNWSDDLVLVDKFVNDLATIPNIRYIHFLGGETLYLKSFYAICEKLIDQGLAKNISIGTTTNCTMYSPQLEKILTSFKHVHLGLSIEAFHHVNDYIRWPSKIDVIKSNIQKFLKLRETTDLQLSLRITPFSLSALHIDTLFEFMLDNSVIAESCNLLMKPSFLRLELLPKDLLEKTIFKIDQVIAKYNLVDSTNPLINRRNEALRSDVISSIIFEYRHLISNITAPDNIEEERHNLVNFIKLFEQLRGNKILDYLPEYEEFLRSYGY